MLAISDRVNSSPERKCGSLPLLPFVAHLPELGESELSSPDLTLAAKAVSADQLEPAINQKQGWSSVLRRVAKKGVLNYRDKGLLKLTR